MWHKLDGSACFFLFIYQYYYKTVFVEWQRVAKMKTQQL